MNSLIYLRRMIVGQKSVRLDYRIGKNTGSLNYERAGFEGTQQEVVKKLRDVFRADAVKVTPYSNPAVIRHRVFAPLAISLALGNHVFDPTARASLLSFVMRLPPLIVRLYPMQRYGFRENAAYMKMHMLFQHNGSLRMQTYISQAGNSHEEMIRLRVMVATYTLGLIAPLNREQKQSSVGQAQQEGRRKLKKASILARIIRRVRGL
jgi:hypothetical protein